MACVTIGKYRYLLKVQISVKVCFRKIFKPRPKKDLNEVKSVIHRQVLWNKVEKSEMQGLNGIKETK